MEDKDKQHLMIEFEKLINVLRQEFKSCENITAFLLNHQKITQIFTRMIQLRLEEIPSLKNKQVREININASKDAQDLLKMLQKGSNSGFIPLESSDSELNVGGF